MEKVVYVVSYEHIDYWHGITDREKLDDLVTQRLLPCSLVNSGRAFIEAGWEGDGDIMAFWIPPFMFRSPDTMGLHVWHVKQDNNGTSWLCAHKPCDFPALDEYDKEWKPITVDEPEPDPHQMPF